MLDSCGGGSATHIASQGSRDLGPDSKEMPTHSDSLQCDPGDVCLACQLPGDHSCNHNRSNWDPKGSMLSEAVQGGTGALEFQTWSLASCPKTYP